MLSVPWVGMARLGGRSIRRDEWSQCIHIRKLKVCQARRSVKGDFLIYSFVAGLFSGISLESSVIGETHNTTVAKVVADLAEFSAARQDANAIAYQMDVTPKQLLSGAVSPPRWADVLIQTIAQAIGDPTPDPSRLSGSLTPIASVKERVEIAPPTLPPSLVPSTDPPLAEEVLPTKDQAHRTPSRAPNTREWDSDPSKSEPLRADIDRAGEFPERRSSNDQAPPGAVKAIALVDHFATEVCGALPHLEPKEEMLTL